MLWVVGVMALAGCKRAGEVHSFVREPFPEQLSAWGLFRGDGSTLEPNPGVIPYDVNTPLFSDYAEKFRTVWMPPGQPAGYSDTDAFDFPVGTILSKTFMYPRDASASGPRRGSAGNREHRYRLIETRLLVRGENGWVALPYIWNDEGTEATLEIVGSAIPVSWTHPSGTVKQIHYMVPNTNQCLGCHESRKRMTPLGLKARHLNRDYAYDEGQENQLVRLTRAGYLRGAPELPKVPRNAVWNDPGSGNLESRARAYLDANCGHCHNPTGPAASSGLYLAATEWEPRALGVCKSPVAAGRGSGQGRPFDIVPGKPDLSILPFRMASVDPGIMMPELGRSLVHEEGVQLVREWIAGLQGECR